MEKSADAFRTISEVADDLNLPQHVLRFWETRFPHIRPLKRAGGRRYYRPADVILLRTIRQLLYDDGYTIKGVQRLLKEQGARGMRAAAIPMPLDLSVADYAESIDVAELVHETDPQADGMAGFASSLLPRDRAGLEQTLATIDECTRILETLRRPSQ